MQREDALAVVFVLLTVVFALTAVVGYTQVRNTTTSTSSSASAASQTTTTSVGSHTNSSERPLQYSSGLSANGLQLVVRLNSSTILSGGVVAAHVFVLNTLSRNVSLQVTTSQNITSWNQFDSFCGQNPSGSLVGFALYGGYFTESNISKAGTPLQLSAPIAIPCVTYVPVQSVTFLAASDETVYSYTDNPVSGFSGMAEVNATTEYCTYSQTSTHCGEGSGMIGYWNSTSLALTNASLSSKSFVYFPLGIYTIVATDDWDQYVYAYFMVVQT
jgi:hypothetical protein